MIVCTVPNLVKVIKYIRLGQAGYVARIKEGKHCFKIGTGKPTGKRSLEKPRFRWKDNIRIDLTGIRGIGFVRLRAGIVGTPFECGIEPPSFISHE